MTANNSQQFSKQTPKIFFWFWFWFKKKNKNDGEFRIFSYHSSIITCRNYHLNRNCCYSTCLAVEGWCQCSHLCPARSVWYAFFSDFVCDGTFQISHGCLVSAFQRRGHSWVESGLPLLGRVSPRNFYHPLSRIGLSNALYWLKTPLACDRWCM